MTIRVLYSHPHVLGRPMGIQTAALEQIRALVEAGANVSVACAHTLVELEGATDVFETLTIAGQRVPHRAFGVDRAYRLHDRRTARYLGRNADRFDVVHTWPLGAASTLARARGLGVVGVREAPNTHTAHAYEIDARVRSELGLPQARGHSHEFNAKRLALEQREYELADRIVVPSDFVYETFRTQGVAAEKLALRAYGFTAAPGAPPTERPPAPGPFTAAFVGRGEPRKGLHVALEAWHESGVAQTGSLLIVGAIEAEYRARLAGSLDHASIEELGFVDDLNDVYRRADALLLPTFEEGSALVTYQAQGCGCALLVSRAAGARMTDGIEGLVHEPGDVETLARQLRMLAHDPGRLTAMQAAAQDNSRHFIWPSAIARQLEIYEDALAQRRDLMAQASSVNGS